MSTLSRDVLRDLGICTCCGKPLHDTRSAFREKVGSKARRSRNAVGGGKKLRVKVESPEADFDLAALLQFIEGKQHSENAVEMAPAKQRPKSKPRARRDAFDETLEEFGRKLDMQHRHKNAEMRLALAEDAKLRLIELCK